MPVTINGRRLGVQDNGHFTSANTDAIPGGRLWPEAALTWNAMRAAYIADGGNPTNFAPAGPNSSARTRAAQDWFWRNQPPPAARPYTSNHGWGIAVDVATRAAVNWMHKNAGRFGWSHDEGARVGEWWHWRYVGAPKAVLDRLKDPLSGYTDSEKRWIREYDKLFKAKQDLPRRRVLRNVMTEQRKRIWRAAQPKNKGGDGRGWQHGNRQARYRSLLARTK